METRNLFARNISVAALLAVIVSLGAHAQSIDPVAPKPRTLTLDEQFELMKLVGIHFQQSVAKDAQYLAAGSFRFVNARTFQYMDRTDTQSFAYENPLYGAEKNALDPIAVAAESLLPRLEESLRRATLDLAERKFVRFQDEFASSAEPAFVSKGFDPRKAGMHMARTAIYERSIKGVPVFGSELMLGLMADGQIGRLRVHWPTLDARAVESALALNELVASGRWTLPLSVQSKQTKILEVTTGVGHSSFATPDFRQGAVVRVLYQTRSADPDTPLQTTGYKYFDAAGKEIVFDLYPREAATLATQKKSAG
jgi:hypothetical protein